MNDERLRQAPSERFATDCLMIDLHANAAALRAESAPTRHGHRQMTLFKQAGRTIALFVLDAGASLSEHAAAGVVTVQVIEGELHMTVAGESRHLSPGGLLIMASGVRHDVRASSPAVFLLQVSLAAPEGER